MKMLPDTGLSQTKNFIIIPALITILAHQTIMLCISLEAILNCGKSARKPEKKQLLLLISSKKSSIYLKNGYGRMKTGVGR